MNELVQKLIADVPLPEDSYLDQDAEIIDIFIEEAAEIIVELKDLFVVWQENLHDIECVKTIRRHFHTLKGSGRMVGANQAGELAWCVEDLLNSILHDNDKITSDIQLYCLKAFEFYSSEVYPFIERHEALDTDIRPFVYLGKALKDQQEVDPSLKAMLLHGQAVEEEIPQEEPESTQVAPSINEKELDRVDEALPETEEIDTSAPVINGVVISQETLAIYFDEAYEHLDTIRQYLDEAQPTSKQTASLVRSIHTLKGSSGMAHIEPICVASANVELSLNSELQERNELHLSLDLLPQFAEFLSHYLQGLKEGNASLRDEATEKFQSVWDNYSQYIKVVDTDKPLINEIVELGVDDLLDISEEFPTLVWDAAEDYLTTLIDQSENLVDWAKEKHLFDLEDYISKLREGYILLLTIAFTDYDLLKKAAPLLNESHDNLIVYFDYIASGQINQILLSHKDDLSEAIGQISHLFSESEYFEEKELSDTNITQKAKQTSENSIQQIIQKLSLDKQTVSNYTSNILDDAELIEIFLDEAEEIMGQIDIDLSAFQDNFSDTDALKNLMRYLHTLKGSANMIQAENFGLIAHHLETIYESLIYQKIDPSQSLIDIVRLIQDQLADRIDTIRHSGIDYSNEHTLSILDHLKGGVYQYDTSFDQTNLTKVEPVNTQPSVTESEVSNFAAITPEFRDHASGQLSNLVKAFTAWTDDRRNRSLLLSVQRTAHVLFDDAKAIEKGIVFEFANLLVDAFEKFAVYQVSTDVHDSLIFSIFNKIRRILDGEDASKVDLAETKKALQKMQLSDESIDVNAIAGGPQYVTGDGAEPPSMMGEWENDSEASQTSEMIRISSNLVDKVSNLTAESSINRSRVEMGMNQFSATLSEMELAVKRLSDQLRRMEGELETQILAKHTVDDGQYEDFDPLEMDQYSSLNQLSKSLAESASDLLDFKATLAEKIRDSESLLLEQARIQTDIYDHLTSVRLVSFSLIESRLQRLVRQTSGTVNRAVDFEVNNSRLEVDRSILDKLVAPLEHMIRNAIDHGIEDSRERLKADKPKAGKLKISLNRQGTDIIIDIEDDGRGINVAKVRRKAESKGLISSNDHLSDEDILQYIFHSGFSTASEVTQLSGRGVGLDVVRSHIRALGGIISVNSVPNKGTKFTIQIPTIVAVTDALMIKAVNQQFALPLSQIERIVRLQPTVVEEYFASSSEYCEIEGKQYRLRYISEFLGYAKQPTFNTNESLPVILLKGYNNQTIALLVDQLVGSRVEIVVKPLDNQLKDIEVLSGATILGDGKVCLILDGQNIARVAQNSQRSVDLAGELDHQRQKADVRHLVMIVDDSVTVRKVTSRLLERNGYEIVTAKDGVDAIEKLETIRPDVMLLDIEMPRMDGFEVANQVRHHEIHHHLPIIMITSRTGEKHRERALSLGVNDYMGKPFQEDTLLEQIENALKASKGEQDGE